MAKKIDSIKHKSDTRSHIPSKEEAGYEDANPKVQTGRKILELPKNPVVHRGQDPELFWLNKYSNDDRDDLLRVDIRSLYRHEHIAPETLIRNLYRIKETESPQTDLFSVNELFGNALEKDEVEKVSEYYRHQDGWTNRLIQGDSHLVMASLLEREGMAGQVQTIYIDPPYGIKYGGNWQIKLNNRDVKDGNDEALTGEPEQIKAFRDTWELGIHSYLSYLRDRLLIAKELLTEIGSCFVQISDENVHLVRSLMDEVFGSENFIVSIIFVKTSSKESKQLAPIYDYILWYAKNKNHTKVNHLFLTKSDKTLEERYHRLETKDGKILKLTKEQLDGSETIPEGRRFTDQGLLTSAKAAESPDDDLVSGNSEPFDFNGRTFTPPNGKRWKKSHKGLERLKSLGRLYEASNTLRWKQYLDDFPFVRVESLWTDTGYGALIGNMKYVVQTTNKVIERCLLMTTAPGDLVLDPTCGSGTTAFLAEQFGRRWITIDTSRIAINIAKQRLMTAVYPYYNLYDEQGGDIRQGF
ncbi:MAG: site-specific DNA-methyltransferase, partial [Ignavibacteriaceae bacterium]|nr:site-specific DNA-methyltransferase [Ignavibacteriaceae bacterium]